MDIREVLTIVLSGMLGTIGFSILSGQTKSEFSAMLQAVP